MTAKHECSKRVSDDDWRWHPCSRNATVQRDGKWYCWQHDPERVKANKKKRQAADKAKMDSRGAMYARRARNAKLAALITLELATLLCDLAAGCDHSAWLAAERGWAMAARIREVLEVNE